MKKLNIFYEPKLNHSEGFTNDNELSFLFESVINIYKGDRVNILEIGSWKGKSANAFMQALSFTGGELHCIDDWSKAGSSSVDCKKVLDKFNSSFCQGFIHDGKSQKLSHIFKDGIFDIIFVDGDHSYEAVKVDITLFYPKLKIGGMFIGHDFRPQLQGRVSQAVIEAFGSNFHKAKQGSIFYTIKKGKLEDAFFQNKNKKESR